MRYPYWRSILLLCLAVLAVGQSSDVLSPTPASSTSSIGNPVGCRHGQFGSSGCPKCASGWQGPFCDACQTDAVCKTELGFSDAICSKSPAFERETVFKSYACSLQNSTLGTVLESFALSCNTTQITDSQGRIGGFCQVGLTTRNAVDNVGVCTVTACVTETGSSKTQCKDADCHCLYGECPEEIAAYQGLIQGKDIELECNQNDPPTCSICIQDFPITVTLPCTIGDCQSASNTAQSSGSFSKAVEYGSPVVAIIASLPLMFLLAMIFCFLLCHFATVYGFETKSAQLPSFPSSSMLEEGQQPRSMPDVTIRFDNVSCTARTWSNPLLKQPEKGADVPLQSMARPGGKESGGMQRATSVGLEHATSDMVLLKNRSMGVAELLAASQIDLAEDSETQAEASQEPEGPRTAQQQPKTEGLVNRVGRFFKRTEIRILKNVSGGFRSGNLVGLLGPSGSGKTTLLSILAGSTMDLCSKSVITGNVRKNGASRDESSEPFSMGLVPQHDCLLPTLTVYESLWYSCRLRTGKQSAEHIQLVSDLSPNVQVRHVIQELGLGDIQDRKIGGSSGIRGISGGEKRRVSMGMELVTDVSVLFLDEPTSGLDSSTALSLLKTCKQVAQSGRIVVASLHQPSARMADLLDQCMLLSQGQLLYHGPISAAKDFCTEAGLMCPDNTEIAEHLLSLAKNPFTAEIMAKLCRDSSHQVESLAPQWNTPGSSQSQGFQRASRESRRSIAMEVGVLSWRTAIDIMRNPGLLCLHISLAVVLGSLCGLIFRNLTMDIAGAQGRLGAVFFTLCLAALTSLTTVDLLSHERQLVLREVHSGYYRAVSYYMTKVVMDGFFLRAVPTIIFCLPLYVMAGLNGGVKQAAVFFCVTATFAVTVGALSMAAATGLKSAGKAAVLMNVVLLIQLLLAGYFKDITSMPGAIRWIHWLSPFFYAFQTLVVNEFRGLSFKFSAGAGVGATLTGDAFLDSVHLEKGHNLRNVGVLDVMYCVFVAMGILFLMMSLPGKIHWK